jgi:hypothetical protein
MDIAPSCPLCTADVFHCHEVSVLHADASSSCSDPWCTLPHHLHEWQDRCDRPDADPCWCTAGRLVAAAVGPACDQAGGRRYTDTWLSLAS